MKANQRDRQKDTSTSGLWWSADRWAQLEELAAKHQRRGMSRQAACAEAYRALTKERDGIPRRSLA